VPTCDLASCIYASQKTRFELQFDNKPLEQARQELKAAELKEFETQIRLDAIQDQLQKYSDSSS
jgi:hypothetical protein